MINPAVAWPLAIDIMSVTNVPVTKFVIAVVTLESSLTETTGIIALNTFLIFAIFAVDIDDVIFVVTKST